MESTGVVRRIDDLGRIVIPKEIRRTLKIKDGASLEIYVDRDMISLKRYSTMKVLRNAEKYTNTIYNAFKNIVIITDKDNIIACSGIKEECNGLLISKSLDNCIRHNKTVVEKEIVELEISEGVIINCSYVIENIIANGESIGLLILASNKNITNLEEKLASVTAKFISKDIEE